MRNYKTYFGVLLLLVFAALTCAQVAPGDEHDTCSNSIPSTDSNVVLLMTSKAYTDLLGEDGVWDEMDFDDNNPETSFQPTNWRHNAGGFCSWSVRSCGFSSGPQDNWLFTQFISMEVPPNTTHTVRAIVDISYTLTSCRARYRCNPVFRLYKFETDGPQPREVYTDRSNYESVRNKTGASAVTQKLTESIAVGPGVGGFYLAIRDLSSCIQLARMDITRYQCRVKQEGLVIFPETAAPMDDQMNVTSLCMPNSTPVSSMNMMCDTEGEWNGTGQCRCDAGYHRVSTDDGDYCEPCPEGFYRSHTDPEYVCLHCPENTEERKVAAPHCKCLVGYFRNTEGHYDECPATQTDEDVSFDCTRPPGMPLNLRESGATDTSLSVSWNHPTYNGGRDDLYYQVDYSDPDNVGVMLEAQCEASCSSQTSCTITGLRPATQYVVRVSAHNGVSDQDQGGALARMTTVTLETDISPPSAVAEVRTFCEVVVWEQPEITNGDILHYGLQFDFANGSSLNFAVSGEGCFLVAPFTYPPDTTLQIFAANEAGAGPSIAVPLPECEPSGTPISPTSMTVPAPSTVSVTVTETSTATETATLTIATPVPTSVLVTVPTTTTATVTDHITATTTEVVTSTVVSTAAAPTPSPVVVHIPTTVTTTATTTTTETSHSTATETETATITATETVVVKPSPIVVPVPTTVVSTSTETEYVTATETDTITAVETTTVVVEPSPVLVPVTTTVTATATETDQITTTTTAFVTTTAIHTPEPTPPPTCPEPPPCNSCCAACPPCPTFTFHTSPNCARPSRKPGEVRNVRMLNCGMIVWDAPEDANCCRDKLSYKVRFFNGTFDSANSANRKVIAVKNSWIKFTADDLPPGRPLQVMVKARKQDGVHSAQWVNAGPLTESYVMDCPSFN